MKKSAIFLIPFFCIFFCAINSGNAQITVTYSSAPTKAEDIIYTMSNVPIDISKTGPNMTWDYSGIVATSQDTYKFLAPKDINPTYGSTFSGDIGLSVKNQNFKETFAFFRTSVSDFRQIGIGITLPVLNLPTPLQFTSPDIGYRFPMKYGNTDSCNYFGTASILGINASVRGTRIDTVDGWGKVITPYKTFDCLRIKSVVAEVDSVGLTVIHNNTIEYKWISANEHIPVLEADIIFNSSGGSTMGIRYRDSYKNFENPNGPNVDFVANDSNVFVKDTVSFQDKSIGMSSWLWTVLPMTYSFVDGTGNSSQNPKIVFNAVGTYSVSLVGTLPSGGGNKKVKLNYINVTHNTGIQPEDIVFRELNVYPNPGSSNILIQTDKSMIGKEYRLSVINVTGQEIINKVNFCTDSSIPLNLMNCPSGLYFVKMQFETHTYEGKLVLR